MHGRTWWLGVLLALLVCDVGCGGDKGGTDAGDESKKDGEADSDKDGGGGAGGEDGMDGGPSQTKTDGGGGTGGSFDANVLDDDGGVELCGAVTCIDPECCADPFQSLCGVGAGRACLMPPDEEVEEDPRCPSWAVATYSFPSCCTPEGDCGVILEMFGFGCLELSEFEMAAESMAMVDLDVPAAQKCD